MNNYQLKMTAFAFKALSESAKFNLSTSIQFRRKSKELYKAFTDDAKEEIEDIKNRAKIVSEELKIEADEKGITNQEEFNDLFKSNKKIQELGRLESEMYSREQDVKISPILIDSIAIESATQLPTEVVVEIEGETMKIDAHNAFLSLLFDTNLIQINE